MPFAGHAFERVSAALLELKPRPDHEVAQRARHQHVVRPCQCADTRADVHGDPTDVIAANLALAGPNEVLVSSTLRDLVFGSGLEFEERGAHQLKGVPGEWHLSAVTSL